MTITIDKAEDEYNAAVAHCEQLQTQWLAGKCNFDELAAARQMEKHLGGRLEAMRERKKTRAQQAEDAAREKNLREHNTRTGKAELAQADALILAGENLSSAYLDALDTCTQYGINPVYFALGIMGETYKTEIRGGPPNGTLDRVRHEFTNKEPLKEARNARAQAVKKLAENNGNSK